MKTCLTDQEMFKEIFWMARRYAEGRRTFSATTVNDIYDCYCEKYGADWDHEDVTLPNWPYASDGDHKLTEMDLPPRPYWAKGREIKKERS